TCIRDRYWSSERKEEKIEKELFERAKVLREKGDYLLHIEDLWWVKDEQKLKSLIELKPFSCSLTWNFDNDLAGGSKANGSLTLWGKKCLKELTQNGVVIDVAHLNRKSFWQVAKILRNHIYCSHTGFYDFRKHKRNLTDKQIDYIVRSNGFIGLFFFDQCTKNKNNIKEFCVHDIVENLNYFTSRWGFNNIGVGSDFYGIQNKPVGLSDYEDFENLKNELQKAGYTKNQIERIFYKNFKSFLSRL
ncbi:MAG: dipeptidase, partial [Clostridia bacterium]|nr:dipeptidase [Clostridia bacterium]